MRILFVMDSLGTGGAERSTSNFWYYLRERNATLKIIVLKHRREGIEEEILKANFDVHFLTRSNFIRQVLDIVGIIKSFRPDLIHSVLFSSNLRVRFAKVVTRFTHIESLVNETYSEQRLHDPNVSWLKLSAYRYLDKITQRFWVDHFHANGNSVAEHYQSVLGISKKRITIITRGREGNPHLGDIINRQKVRAELSTGDRLLIVCVGRQEFQKGHDILLRVFANLIRYSQKLQLIILGRYGNFSNTLTEIIEGNELKDHVILAGHRNDVSSILAASDIFVFPSRFEGLPGALIEAEAAGLPIICSNIKNNLEVVRQGINALTFPINDSMALEDCLNRLLDNHEEREKMKKQSLKIFNENFSINTIHYRMEVLFENLIKENKMRYV